MLDSYSGRITELTLQNFKGIGDTPVKIPLRPITLLFGKNSAGKSTILQALLYTREILRTGRVDVDLVELGGATINLGGFNNFVHLHEVGRAVKIRFDLDLKIDYQYDRGVDNKDNSGKKVYVEFIIQYVDGYLSKICNLGTGDTPYVSCKWKHNEKRVLYQLYKHKIFDRFFKDNDSLPSFESEDPFPLLGHTIKFKFEDEHLTDSHESAIPSSFVTDDFRDTNSLDRKKQWDLLFILRRVLNKYITRPLEILKNQLEPLRYIGPIREILPRDYGPRYTLNNERWANGLAAWDILMNPILENSNDLLQKVNAALKNLQLDYELHKRHFIALELNDGENIDAFRTLAEKLSKMDEENLEAFLQNEPKLKGDIQVFLKEKTKNIEVALCDIGVGISQVLPVVVGALAENPNTNERPSILAIEQPELHVHPAVQCELGDLFIRECKNQMFLIETHSEHLILRILRRIKECYEGTLFDPTLKLNPNDLAVLAIDNKSDFVDIKRISITNQGGITSQWPGGFFDERYNELMGD